MPPSSSPDVAPVRQGDILDGKYRVERVLGVGGMGVVVAATHVQLQTRVALKFLLPDVLGNPQVVQRFAREARAAVQIQSEHVARVIDVGTLPTGSPYMVMEYLEGEDLSETLAKGGPVAVARAVGYLLQACEALAEAHALGIVHRDLKPANLFLARRAGRDSIVKVLDFGISKTNETATSGLTQTSNVMGSPQYMAPEQMMSSKNVDVRADIWALGVILYELLTGERPFMAETMAEIVYMVTQRDAPALLAKRPDLPPAIGAAVARALAREPARRYANVAELAAAIAPFGPPRSEISIERIARVLGTNETAPAQPSPAKQAPTQASFTTGPTLDEAAPVTAPRGRRLVGAAAVAIALLVALVSWRALRGRSETAPAHTADAVIAPPPAPASLAPPPASPSLAPPPAPSAPPSPPKEIAAPAAPPAKIPSADIPVPARHAAHASTKPAKAHGAAAHPTATAPVPAPPPQAPARGGLNMGMKE